MTEKLRLDTEILNRGLAQSREKAKAYIMAGVVYVNNQKADKAGTVVKPDDLIEVRASEPKYVSRGGLKLEKAMARFGLDLTGCVCADIGASTGGFTDCMLQNGAERVYAVDVGYGQLAWKLRSDSRVVNLERTNFRYVTAEQIPRPLDFASVDVSFISLKLILPPLMALMKPGAQAVCLIKPQFEAGKGKVGKKGVVRDRAVHLEVIGTITDFALRQGFSVRHLDFSPIKGPEGNIEYLMHIQNDGKGAYGAPPAEEVVRQSHAALDKTEKDEA